MINLNELGIVKNKNKQINLTSLWEFMIEVENKKNGDLKYDVKNNERDYF